MSQYDSYFFKKSYSVKYIGEKVKENGKEVFGIQSSRIPMKNSPMSSSSTKIEYKRDKNGPALIHKIIKKQKKNKSLNKDL